MKSVILLGLLMNNLFGQTYGSLDVNRGPDHGNAKNYGWTETKGILDVPYVRSEIVVNNQTYSYIRTGDYEFKISRKVGNQFQDVVTKIFGGSDSQTIGGHSRLLHVYEDREKLNIYSWVLSGYNLISFQKLENNEPRLIRSCLIQNAAHIMEEGFDRSIKDIQFTGGNRMKITKEATKSDPRTECDYEFRPDGVYLNGVFDPSVKDFDSQEATAENLRKDPQHYLKKQALHAERVASWNKELMDAEAARKAAQAPQPVIQPRPLTSHPEPTVAPSSIPKTPAATTEPESTLNFTPWLAGLVALLVMLLGYLGVRYIRRRA